MKNTFNEYKEKAGSFAKEKGYDEKAKNVYSKVNNYAKEKGYDEKAKNVYTKANDFAEEKGIKAAIKKFWINFKKGSTSAVLIMAAIVILFSSVLAYDNMTRKGWNATDPTGMYHYKTSYQEHQNYKELVDRYGK